MKIAKFPIFQTLKSNFTMKMASDEGDILSFFLVEIHWVIFILLTQVENNFAKNLGQNHHKKCKIVTCSLSEKKLSTFGLLKIPLTTLTNSAVMCIIMTLTTIA